MKRRAVVCILLLLSMTALAASAVSPGESTGCFTITYCNGSAHHADNAALLSTLEESYDCVNGYFGSCPDHVEVIVIDDNDMDKVGKQVDSFFAWNKAMSAIILRQSIPENDTQLPVIARHEMTHLAINNILCKKDPAEFQWMEEGMCMVVSREPLDDTDVSRYIVSHGFLNTSGIFSAIKDENCTVSKNGYMNSYSLVKYIVQRYGMSKVIDIIECPEAGFDKAFLQCTGEDFRSFRTGWEKYVAMTAS